MSGHHPPPRPKAGRGLLYFNDVAATLIPQNGGYSISYDDRSFIIAGRRTLLLSGSVHYPRASPAQWAGLFKEMVEDGLNMVELYLFWNLHEFRRGQAYDLSGRANWTLFVEKAASAGLFVNLRIGPYVCAEWNYGGLPVWLNSIPGMKLRSSVGPWEGEMERFSTDMVKLAEPYLARNGGPIILAQIENEFRFDDPSYVAWCGQLAARLAIGVPWLMCSGYSASNTINACNADDCTEYAQYHAKDHPGQPLVWTEDEGWFQEWDRKPMLPSYDDRPPEDMAFVLARWFARGGAHHNYYMWFGGNHVARWAGAAVTSKYADGVNVHCDGQPNEPKKTHLRRLHSVLADYGATLLACPSQINSPAHVLVLDASTGQFVNATKQVAYVYQSGGRGLAFIENTDSEAALVMFDHRNYSLPSSSSSLTDLPSGKELYNTGRVDSRGLPTKWVFNPLLEGFHWRAWQEDVRKLAGAFSSDRPREQLDVTQDETDYLFYQTTVRGQAMGNTTLSLNSTNACAFTAFLDGEAVATTYNAAHSYANFTAVLSLFLPDTGPHQLTIASISLGISNVFRRDQGLVLKGITGAVTLGSEDITAATWWHRAKMEGEVKQVFTAGGATKVTWDPDWERYQHRALVWFQTTFSWTHSDGPVLIDMKGAGRGHVYVNGLDLGRYWLVEVGGATVQRYYAVPMDWLQADNTLTILEEGGATDLSTVAIGYSSVEIP